MQPNDPQAQPYPTSGQMGHPDQPPPYGQTWPPQGQGPYPPAPSGPAPAWPPHGGQQPSPSGPAPAWPPQGGPQPSPYGQPPPYAQAPPPYLQQTDAAREASQQKGKRDIAFGVVWLLAGLLITGITMGSGSSVYIVAWGPMLYGLYKIIKGVLAVSANKV
jgi:hypothetical protein